ncbi:Hypothetical predicted protein [Scomber scombrus]|uniref:Uncharacterized protein n=1 Tax=Scomber scombrus TaxID=13677 RepID=A0AAV1N4S2_SCOSC
MLINTSINGYNNFENVTITTALTAWRNDNKTQNLTQTSRKYTPVVWNNQELLQDNKVFNFTVRKGEDITESTTNNCSNNCNTNKLAEGMKIWLLDGFEEEHLSPIRESTVGLKSCFEYPECDVCSFGDVK